MTDCAPQDLAAQARSVPKSAIPALLALLAARLLEPEATPEPEPEDRMLDTAEVARRLGISVESVYRRRLPFRVKVSRRCTRYSERGLEAWLANGGRVAP